jgi:hypothetical protein
MAGLKGKSGPPGNMNAFKHGLAVIQKRREEDITTEHEESVRQQILDGLMIGLNDASGRFRRMECRRSKSQVHGGYNSGIRAEFAGRFGPSIATSWPRRTSFPTRRLWDLRQGDPTG